MRRRTAFIPMPQPLARGGVIGAHTVQKNGGQLNQIARAGEVYGVYRSYLDYVKGRSPFTLTKIASASTHNCFCRKHDAIFEPIENSEICFNAQQIFLFSYRALYRGFYVARQQVKLIPLQRELDRGKDLDTQKKRQAKVDENKRDKDGQFAMLKSVKDSFDSMLLDQRFDGIASEIFESDRVPEILGSNVLLPNFDFKGNKIPQEVITCSIVALSGRGAVVFSWDGRVKSRFADSLSTLPAAEIPHAIVRVVFSYLENTFLSPDWWDAVPAKDQELLEERFVDGMGNKLGPEALKDDELRVVNWGVSARSTPRSSEP